MPGFPVISFNGGEVTPLIDARSDIAKFKDSCRTLQNMIPRMYGPAERRPGTKYIDTTVEGARLKEFLYSDTISYILLFEDYKMYFYKDGARVLDGGGSRLEVVTPYPLGDLFELQFKQVNDVMWITHQSYAPRKLSRTSATAFSLDTITFTNGPFKVRNDLDQDDDVTMTPSVTTGNGTLTASSSTFNSSHVGALWSIWQPRAATSTSGSRTGTGIIGSNILTEGDCTLNLEDGWVGTVELQRSIDSGSTWEVRRSYTSKDGYRSVQYTFTEEEDDILHRIYVTTWTSGTVAGDLTVNSSAQQGICRITGYTSPTVVSMTVLKNFAATSADKRWAEGSWSDIRGYPKCCTFFGDRCYYGGTPHEPQTIWASAVGDYQYFKYGSDDDSAFRKAFLSDTRNVIDWMSAIDSVLIGTSGGVYRLRGKTYDEPITPENSGIRRQNSKASAPSVQSIVVDDAVLYANRVADKLREAVYSFDSDKIVSNDLNALAEHIAKEGIVQLAWQDDPDPIMWMVLGDGTLLSLTYEKSQKVIAWAKHTTVTGLEGSQYV